MRPLLHRWSAATSTPTTLPTMRPDVDLVTLEASPADATEAELDTVRRIRTQLNPDFTVEDLRRSRTRAIHDANNLATRLEAAGLTDEAHVYRTLALELTPPQVSVGGR